MNALVSGLPSRNGWTIAEQAGDRSPAWTQRLLNRASWDEAAAMSQVRRYAAAGLDETGQEKQGSSTSGVEAAVHGLRRAGRERGQHGPPVLRAGERAPKATAGTPGRGSPPPRPGTACWTAGTSALRQFFTQLLAAECNQLTEALGGIIQRAVFNGEKVGTVFTVRGDFSGVEQECISAL
jgi:hypothetical protein